MNNVHCEDFTIIKYITKLIRFKIIAELLDAAGYKTVINTK